ncbi:MAG: carbohydrate porin [Zetaproteobacteria bacterium]|nr:MAG: carbohydrate porin [Zetaproteobacteria bacterium]
MRRAADPRRPPFARQRTPSSPAPNRATDCWRRVPLKHQALITAAALTLFAGGALADEARQPVTTELSYSFEGDKNFSGGLRKGSATLGSGLLDVTFDSEAAGWWPGGTLFIEGLLDHGRNPSDFIGDVQTASNIADGNRTRLQQMWYEQRLGQGLSLLAGLHDLNSEFDVSEYASLFLNSSFGIAPDISANAQGISIFPQAGWAVRLFLQLNEAISLRMAVYDGDPTTRTVTGREGYMKIVEAAWSSGEAAWKIGGWQHSGDKTAPDGRLYGSNGGIYGVIDQPLTRWEGGALGLFVQWGLAQKDRNDFSNYLGAGIHVAGPIPGRGDDEFGLAVARAGFSDIYRRVNGSTRAETAIEATYQLQLRPWLQLHPAFQWILHPGGDPKLADAKVGMLRATITLP